MKESRLRTPGLWQVTSVVIVLVLIGSALAIRARNATQGESNPGQLIFPNKSPIHGGRIVDLATAEEEMPFLIPAPSSPQANPDSLIEVWSEPEAPEVGFVYESGKARVVLDLYPTVLLEPETAYQEEIDLKVSGATIININGEPALLTEPGSDVPGTNPAWLRFVHDGVDVNLFSADYSPSDLVAIARSISFADNPT